MPPVSEPANRGGSNAFTLQDLAGSTNLIAVEGSVYDLKSFAPKHPGGELIRAAGGTDGTALFYSMHPHNPAANLKVLAKYRVGSLVERKDLPKFDFATPFATELKARVAEAMGNNRANWYAPVAFWLRTLGIMAATCVFEYNWVVTGNWVWGVLAGWMHAWIGLAVQHDASHGAFAASPAINAFFSYGADWIGNNRWLWMQQHVIGHHPHTNIAGFDPDAHSAEPVILFHPYSKEAGNGPKQWFHGFQHWFMHLVLPWYGPSLVFDMKQLKYMRHGDEVPHNAWTRKQRPMAVISRVWYIVRIMVLPWLIGGAPFLASLLTVPLVAGAHLTYLFVVSHNFENSDRYPEKQRTPEGAVDWYRLQVETACSYGGWLAMFFSGGLNMQIEHHLFPRLSSWYYPQIAPIVQEVCAKHGVKYAYYPNIVSNTISTLRYMAKTGHIHT